MEQEEAAIGRQWHGKQINTATIDKLLEVMFSVWSESRLYSKDQKVKSVSKRLELAGKSQELQVSGVTL